MELLVGIDFVKILFIPSNARFGAWVCFGDPFIVFQADVSLATVPGSFDKREIVEENVVLVENVVDVIYGYVFQVFVDVALTNPMLDQGTNPFVCFVLHPQFILVLDFKILIFPSLLKKNVLNIMLLLYY